MSAYLSVSLNRLIRPIEGKKILYHLCGKPWYIQMVQTSLWVKRVALTQQMEPQDKITLLKLERPRYGAQYCPYTVVLLDVVDRTTV